MSDQNPNSTPTEVILEWEGSVNNDPGNLNAVKEKPEVMNDTLTLAGAALWLCGTVFEAVVGDSIGAVIRTKVGAFLGGWRNNRGKSKFEELKEHVLATVDKQFSDPKQAEKIRQEVEQLFDRVDG